MKRFQTIIGALILTAMLMLNGCGEPESNIREECRLNKTSLSLEVGEKDVLELLSGGAVVTGNTVWFSSNNSIATVDRGTVTAVQSGTCVVTVSCAGQNYTCTVTVAAGKSYSLSADTLELAVGETEEIRLLEDGTAVEGGVTWVSSNPLVASVKSGLVSAKKEGDAVVSASYRGGKYTCAVTVLPAEYVRIVNETTEVSFDSPNSDRTEVCKTMTASAGEVFELKCETKNEISLVYSSSDEEVAEIDAAGCVRAKKAGVTVVSAACGEEGPNGETYRDEVVLVVSGESEGEIGSILQAPMSNPEKVVRLNLYSDNTFSYYGYNTVAAESFSTCSGVYVRASEKVMLYYMEDGVLAGCELTQEGEKLISSDLQADGGISELVFTACAPAGRYHCKIEVEAMEETFEFDLDLTAEGAYTYFRYASGVMEEGEVNRGTWKIEDGLLVLTHSKGVMRFEIVCEGCLKSVGNIPTGGMEAQLTFYLTGSEA